ncbi:MAG: peptidoglycan editing factor PgeF [Kofleriaceae bacterium]
MADAPETIRILRSWVIPTEGFVHGFPERTGGVSVGLRRSLNLGRRWGDDEANVIENRRLLAAYAGYDPSQLHATRHVHGTGVWNVRDSREADEYDGVVSDVPGAVLGAFAADCVPIVFADPEARVVGACHAGWRGTIGSSPGPSIPASPTGIVTNVIAKMVELGARTERIRMALGPSIGPCCFEVGDEVVDEFRAAFARGGGEPAGLVVDPPAHATRRDGPAKKHIDLRIANRTVAERAGVRPESIDDRPPCTKCESDRFFSYRRDGRDGGVHMGFIGLVPRL